MSDFILKSRLKDVRNELFLHGNRPQKSGKNGVIPVIYRFLQANRRFVGVYARCARSGWLKPSIRKRFHAVVIPRACNQLFVKR